MVFGGLFRGGFVPAFDAGGALVAVPYSLSYDGNDVVDCGNGASIVGLNAGNFTVDAYFRMPASGLSPYNYYCIASQGSCAPGAASRGWAIILFSQATPPSGTLVMCLVADSVGSGRYVYAGSLNSYSSWGYVRMRRNGDTLYGKLNNAAEVNAWVGSGGTTSTQSLRIGKSSDASPIYLKGSVCYLHAWNTNKGTLASVPTSPFPADANTKGRWIHSEGSGVSLADTSGNGNNGTISGATWGTTVPAGWTI